MAMLQDSGDKIGWRGRGKIEARRRRYGSEIKAPAEASRGKTAYCKEGLGAEARMQVCRDDRMASVESYCTVLLYCRLNSEASKLISRCCRRSSEASYCSTIPTSALYFELFQASRFDSPFELDLLYCNVLYVVTPGRRRRRRLMQRCNASPEVRELCLQAPMVLYRLPQGMPSTLDPTARHMPGSGSRDTSFQSSMASFKRRRTLSGSVGR